MAQLYDFERNRRSDRQGEILRIIRLSFRVVQAVRRKRRFKVQGSMFGVIRWLVGELEFRL